MMVQITHRRGKFERGEERRPIVKYRDTPRSSMQNVWTDRHAFWVVGSDRPKELCVRWESRHAEGRCHGNRFWDAICYNWLFGFRWAVTLVVW